MEEKMKQRVFGTVIVLALGVIFVPMLFDKKVSDQLAVDHNIPVAPEWSQADELLLPSERLSANMTNDALLQAPADMPSSPASTTAEPPANAVALPPPPATTPDATVNSQATPAAAVPASAPATTAPASTTLDPSTLPASAPPVMSTAPAQTTKPAAAMPQTTAKKASPAKSALMAYTVQVGTFENQANAKKLASKLRQAGYTAYVTDSYSNGKATKRVMIGPSASRAEADKTSLKLQQEFKMKTLVVKYDPRD